MRKSVLLTALFLFLPISFVQAATGDEEKVQQILKMDKAPSGVVFEIAVSDKAGLKWAIPRIQEYIQQLRKRFPELEMAVVTHGNEQFALMEKKKGDYQNVHNAVEHLVSDDKVPVHICGTHASWRNVTPEDFPEYVDVAPAGPTQVRDYQDLGYLLVMVRRY